MSICVSEVFFHLQKMYRYLKMSMGKPQFVEREKK